MKMKKILAAVFATMMLTSGIAAAAISTYSVNESTMKTKSTTRSRTCIFVKNGSSYTEYYSSLSGKDAAREIAEAVGTGTVEAYTPNDGLLRYLKELGDVNMLESMRIPGADIYHFTFRYRMSPN